MTDLIFPYDLETTGFHHKNKALDDPAQPHLVQVSAFVMDTSAERVLSSMNLVVKPDGWEIPEAAEAVHGISTSFAEDMGLPEKIVLEVLLSLWDNRPGLVRVAHNADFDRSVVATAVARHYGPASPILEAWLNGSDFCTMKASKDIVQARNARGAIKWPKLTEAYLHFFDEELDRAHTANADAMATAAIYMALKEREANKQAADGGLHLA